MKPLYRAFSVPFFFVSILMTVSTFAFAQTAISIFTPQGWTKFSLEAIPTNDPSTPKSVLELAEALGKEPTFKLVAYDPKAYLAKKSAVMYVQEIPYGELSEPTEKGFLEGRGECYAKQAGAQGATLVERRGFQAYGKFVERVVTEVQATKTKKIITETTYLFIHQNNIYQVTFRSDKDTFPTYAAIFQGSLVSILKAVQ